MTTPKKIAAIAAVLLIGVSFLSGSSSHTCHAVYTTYKVQSGDTFWTVVQRYFEKDSRRLYLLEYHDEIRELNPEIAARNCQLKPGDVLNLRYYEE